MYLNFLMKLLFVEKRCQKSNQKSFGECVNRPNDIASILRKLSNKAVINLGYGSNGPIIEYAALREYYPKNTKKILWLYSEINDLFDINEELKNKVLKNYFDNEKFTQNLKTKQDLIDEIVLNKIYLERNVKTKFNIKEFLIYFVKHCWKLMMSCFWIHPIL